MKNKKEYLIDYMFHHNPYSNLWHCFKRDNKDAYFNNGISELSHEKLPKLLKELHIVQTKK